MFTIESAHGVSPRVVNLAPATAERVGGAAAPAGAVIATIALAGPQAILLLLFFAPDLSAVAFAGGAEAGVSAYNAAHRWTVAVALVLLGVAAALAGFPALLIAGLLWLGHVGFDRAVGYGLKEVR